MVLPSHWYRGPTVTVRYKDLYDNAQWVRLTHTRVRAGTEQGLYRCLRMCGRQSLWSHGES